MSQLNLVELDELLRELAQSLSQFECGIRVPTLIKKIAKFRENLPIGKSAQTSTQQTSGLVGALLAWEKLLRVEFGKNHKIPVWLGTIANKLRYLCERCEAARIFYE